METEYWLSTSSKLYPDKVAINFNNTTITFEEYYNQVVKAISILNRLSPNSRSIGILMESRLEYIYFLHASAMSNRICTPINSRLSPSELEFIISNAGITLIITSERYIETITSDVKKYNCVNFNDEIFQPLSSNFNIKIDEIFLQVYTSGTTGFPKAAEISYQNVQSNALSSRERLGSVPNDNWLLNLPLFHVGGLSIIFRSCIYGTSITLVEKYDLIEISRLLGKNSITMISVVPTILRRMFEDKDLINSMQKLRVILVGGDRTPISLVNQSLSANLNLYTTYGMTESFSQIATATPNQLRDNPETVGYPLDGIEITVLNSLNSIALEGEIGEIIINGPQVIKSYLQQDKDRWNSYGFKTGDMGYTDSNGQLYIVQRRTDLIISGGENIYPSEVENVIRRIDGVIDVIVLGVDDEEWNAISVALVETKEKLIAEDVISYCKANLANYKVPKKVIFTDSLPRTISGKVKRNEAKNLII